MKKTLCVVLAVLLTFSVFPFALIASAGVDFEAEALKAVLAQNAKDPLKNTALLEECKAACSGAIDETSFNTIVTDRVKMIADAQAAELEAAYNDAVKKIKDTNDADPIYPGADKFGNTALDYALDIMTNNAEELKLNYWVRGPIYEYSDKCTTPYKANNPNKHTHFGEYEYNGEYYKNRTFVALGTSIYDEVDYYGVDFPVSTKAEVAETLSSALAVLKAEQARELKAEKNAALARIEVEDEADPLSTDNKMVGSTAKIEAKKAVNNAATKAAVAAAESNGIKAIDDAVAAQLQVVKSAALKAVADQNALDPVNSDACLTSAAILINNAKTKAEVNEVNSSALELALELVTDQQEFELARAREATASALTEQNEQDPVVFVNAEGDTLFEEIMKDVVEAGTKAKLAEILSNGMPALIAQQAAELEAAKNFAVKSLVNVQAQLKVDATVYNATLIAVNEAETKKDVAEALNEGIATLFEQFGDELDAAIEAAKDALTAANDEDPLEGLESVYTAAIERLNDLICNNKAEVAEYLAANLEAIRAAQALELAAEKVIASEAIASTANALAAEIAEDEDMNPDYVATIADTLATELAIIDACETKAAVREAAENAEEALEAAAENDVAASKEIAKEQANLINDADPVDSAAVLSNGLTAIDSAATLAEINDAQSSAIADIKAEQAVELEAAIEAAIEALDAEDAKDELIDSSALNAGKEDVAKQTTKALVESSANAAIAAIQAQQATELATAQAEAKADVDAAVKADDVQKVKDAAEEGKTAIGSAATKAEVPAAKEAAIENVEMTRALVPAQEAAMTKLGVAGGKAPSAKVQEIIKEGKAAIDAAKTPEAANEALLAALNAVYAQRTEEKLEKYDIMDGTAKYNKATDGDAAFRSNADFDKFAEVQVDGKKVDAKNYTVAEGSTVVTFKADYMKTLAEGKHTVAIVSNDGKAVVEFTVVNEAPVTPAEPQNPGEDPTPAQPESPDTGDNAVWFVIVSVVAVLGLGVTAVVLNKKKEDY